MRNQPLRTRTRNSSWQWLVIGVILGVGCASMACLGGYVLGAIRIGLPGSLVADLPSPTPPPTYTAYPTYTPFPTITAGAPALPTQTSASLVTQPTSQAGSTSIVVFASPTQFQPINTPGGPSATPPSVSIVGGSPSPVVPTIAPVTPERGTDLGSPDGLNITPPASEAMQQFESTATELVTITGGRFYLGTDVKEAQLAVADCTSRDKGQCKIEDAQDSTFKHFVTLDTFQIEKYEVSVDQYVNFLATLPANSSVKIACGGQPCFAPQDNTYKFSAIKLDGTLYKAASDLVRDRPMIAVTWYGAKAYCEALGRRLPTEMEWERAARSKGDGDTMSIYPWGDQWDGTLANSSRPSQNSALPVKSYEGGRSAEGVFNLAGNVSEWVNDWYGANYYRDNGQNQNKPKGPANGTEKVVRGGDYSTVPFFLRSTQRRSFSPTTISPTIGFRCAKDGTGTTPPISGGNAGPAPTLPALIPTKPVGTLTP